MHRWASTATKTNPSASTSPLGTVGIWRLTQLLHAGQWCDLYAAQPADAAGSPRSDYAVKITRQSSQAAPEAARQVRMEATVAAAARHQHLIPVLDHQLNSSRPYIVMPRIAGAPLTLLLERSSQPLPVALWWTRQSAQAVAALHTAGYAHCDLKPDNLLIDDRGHLTVVDLGLAQRIGTPADGDGSSAFRGTPRYAAPERLKDVAPPIDAAIDIYALGVVLQELLSTAQPSLPGLDELVASMLSCDVEARPSAKQLVETLLRLEIETLHHHIRPDGDVFRRQAA